MDLIQGVIDVIEQIWNWLVNTFNSFISGIENSIEWFFGALRTISQSIADLIATIGALAGGAIRIIQEFMMIASLIIQIAWELIRLITAWVFYMVQVVTGIIQQFFNASPVPLPGMPRCISAPRQHDLCAAWHLTDSTLFAGSIGGLIITLFIIIVDIMIIFFFARRVLSYLRQGEEITNVA